MNTTAEIQERLIAEKRQAGLYRTETVNQLVQHAAQLEVQVHNLKEAVKSQEKAYDELYKRTIDLAMAEEPKAYDFASYRKTGDPSTVTGFTLATKEDEQPKPKPLTVEQARELVRKLEASITSDVRQFSQQTGLRIEDLEFRHVSIDGDVYVQIKVEL